ncbi:DUF4760 domain-containing protein [Acinetobacter baumannii]|uniref:DUF4760 domain-containing protein n=1 Tax=Acinetobacter baumannii TaxID=470 RepID=UPI000D69CDAE|nr:DUF4760 domain-containing protein [Acinetobacter baumannii]MCJ9179960.1 DUF4760 domain-containing protein [Acinetobacter baumannii]MCJ9183425.1 DUF4760 domain-containing protein [Acinetobacter baumannii]MCJ9190722.1 DUF4760 domain-containing protein [Acinetobacter baumannii]MCJ9198459.1 DUF4760 domain-containing protein [Acinetobacter baumannii]MCJ9220687.1 DUF4760 domain-containing protein [Acinetobacter baumannii]
MSITKFSFIQTYLLIVPYITVLIYFFIYKRDNFFVKIRSSIQLLMMLILLGLVFVNILIWKGFFKEYEFLGFDLVNTDKFNKTTALVTILAAIAAVFGWIFTSRVQIVNTVRGHSVQVLMNSRTSTIYLEKVDIAMKLRRCLIKEAILEKNSTDNIYLSVRRYKRLSDQERSAVHYLLNFLEFIAVGVRHNNLDESLIKGSLRTILKSNYMLFRFVIEHLRGPDNQPIYDQLEALHKRWDEEQHSKCAKCREWFKVSNIDNKAYKYILFIVLSLLTCGGWIVMIIIMDTIEWLTTHREDEKFICIDCGKE